MAQNDEGQGAIVKEGWLTGPKVIGVIVGVYCRAVWSHVGDG